MWLNRWQAALGRSSQESERARRRAPLPRLRRKPYLEALEDRTLLAFDLTISAGPTFGVHFDDTTPGVRWIVPLLPGSNVDVADILAGLNLGRDVVVSTGGLSGENGDLTWAAGAHLTYAAAAPRTLRLLTDQTSRVGHINVRADITTTGGALHVMFQAETLGVVTLAGSIRAGGGTVLLEGANGITLSGPAAGVTTTGTYTANADRNADGTGVYTQNDAGSAVRSGPALITAADVALAGTVAAGAAPVTLRPSTAAPTVGLQAPGTFNLTDAELDNITTTDTVTVDAIVNRGDFAVAHSGTLTQGAKNLQFRSAGAVIIGAHDVVTTGDLRVEEGAGFTTGGGVVRCNELGVFTLGVGGAITVTAAASRFSADVGGAINLTNTAATLTVLNVRRPGGVINITNSGGIALTGFLNAGSTGSNTLTAGGPITLSGGGRFSGGSLTTRSVGGTLLLPTAASGVGRFDAVNTGGGDIHLVNNRTPSLVLFRLSQSGSGSVVISNTNGFIDVTGEATVAGPGRLTIATVGGAHNLLTSAPVTAGGAVELTATGDVAVRSSIQSIAGPIRATAGRDLLVDGILNTGGAVELSAARDTVLNGAALTAASARLTGSAAVNALTLNYGAAFITTWTVSGVGSGSVVNGALNVPGGLAFSALENLIGGDAADIFAFTGSGRLAGTVDGRGGVDTLGYEDYAAGRTLAVSVPGGVDGALGTDQSGTSSLAGFGNINILLGSPLADTFHFNGIVTLHAVEGVGGDDTYNIMTNLTAHLLGGAGDDLFRFPRDSVSLLGALDGGSGADALHYAGFAATVVTTVVTGPGVIDGVAGTSTALAGGFSNLEAVTAGAAAGNRLRVQGTAGPEWFAVTATALWFNEATLTYANFGSLTVNALAGDDAFIVAGTIVPTLLDGGTGANALLGPDVPAFWLLAGTDTGAVAGPGLADPAVFTAVQHLFGGAGDDYFLVAEGALLTGLLDGGAGAGNALDYSGWSAGVLVNLPLAFASGLGGIAHIQFALGGAGDDLFVGDDASNFFVGGSGRDVLIGGGSGYTLQPDALLGGAGEDLLIAGYTVYDADLDALGGILAEWTRTDLDYDARADNLHDGTGLAPALNDQTAFSSDAGSTVLGEEGRDLFYANRTDVPDTTDWDESEERFVDIF